ncbi:MAG TPA: isocitrate dehydrogenase kinase/phosphatase AceK regulatory subunit, partial [Pusillimonas sp.]
MTFVGDHQRIEQVQPAGLSPQAVAQAMLDGFNRHYALFRYGAQRAKSLFESGNWRGIQQLAQERIEYYDTRVNECTALLARALKGSDASPTDASAVQSLTPAQMAFWQAAKSQYVLLLSGHRQPECAETFFNSVSCRILHRDYFHNDFLFVRPAIATEYLDSKLPSYRVYYPATEGLENSLIKMVADFGLAAPFADLPADARTLARMALRQLRRLLPRGAGQRIAPDCQIHVLNSLFFRNKGAYIV